MTLARSEVNPLMKIERFGWNTQKQIYSFLSKFTFQETYVNPLKRFDYGMAF